MEGLLGGNKDVDSVNQIALTGRCLLSVCSAYSGRHDGGFTEGGVVSGRLRRPLTTPLFLPLSSAVMSTKHVRYEHAHGDIHNYTPFLPFFTRRHVD